MTKPAKSGRHRRASIFEPPGDLQVAVVAVGHESHGSSWKMVFYIAATSRVLERPWSRGGERPQLAPTAVEGPDVIQTRRRQRHRRGAVVASYQ